MTDISISPKTSRLNRSELAVPGSSARFIEKAATSDADIIFLDLEDSVPADRKEQARKDVIAALNELDFGSKSISVRINSFETQYMYRDLIDLVEQAGHKLDLLLIPKVESAAQIQAVDMLLTQIELAKEIKQPIGIECLIETPLGMQNIFEIAAASPRNESLFFGSADYAAATGAQITMIGGPNADYHILTDPDATGARHVHWGDMWHFHIARLVAAARAHGLRPIDGPYADIKDAEGWLAAAQRAKTLGCEGKMMIHPNQIKWANDLFKPSEAEIAQARRILHAMEQARVQGSGAVVLDGKMIDIASIRQAEATVAKWEQARLKDKVHR